MTLLKRLMWLPGGAAVGFLAGRRAPGIAAVLMFGTFSVMALGIGFSQVAWQLFASVAVFEFVRQFMRWSDAGYLSEHMPSELRSTAIGCSITFSGLGSTIFGWLAAAEEIRSATGPGCDLMIDCGSMVSVQSAHRLIDVLRSVRMLFVEEPTSMDTPQRLIELRKAFPDIRTGGERSRRGVPADIPDPGALPAPSPDLSAELCAPGFLGRCLQVMEIEAVATDCDKHRPKNQLNKLMKTSAACILRLEFGFAGSVHQLADDFMQQSYG